MRRISCLSVLIVAVIATVPASAEPSCFGNLRVEQGYHPGPTLPDSYDVACAATMGRAEDRVLYPGINFVEFAAYNNYHETVGVRVTGLGYDGDLFTLEQVDDWTKRSERVPIDPTLEGCVVFDMIHNLPNGWTETFTYRTAGSACP